MISITQKIIELPRRHEQENKSFLALFNDLKIPLDFKPDFKLLKNVLAKNPDLQKLWQQDIEDQRTVPSWGITMKDSFYFLEYIDDNPSKNRSIKFETKLDALVRYIQEKILRLQLIRLEFRSEN